VTRREWTAIVYASRIRDEAWRGRTFYLADQFFAGEDIRSLMSTHERERYDEAIGVKVGDVVTLPICFPEFLTAGHRALVLEEENEFWVLELDCDPEPAECGENTMLWPKEESGQLGVPA